MMRTCAREVEGKGEGMKKNCSEREIERKILAIFAEKSPFKNLAGDLATPLRDNYRSSLFSFLCSFQRCNFYGVCKKKILSSWLI